MQGEIKMENLKQVYILNNFEECSTPIMKVNTGYLLENGLGKLLEYKNTNPDTKILLDTKLCDSDYHLVENQELKDIDFITVQGGIHYKTILYVLKKAREAKMEVVVDVSGAMDLNDALEDMMIFGVNYVSIDNDDFIKLPN